MCKSTKFDGYFTNHSIRATIATRLFEANVDEQLIMQRTIHTSSAVRSYKRIDEKLRGVTSGMFSGSISINNEPKVKEEKRPLKYQANFVGA